jgi:hypothetical protein
MNKYIIVDIKKKTVIREFHAENDDDAIAYVFSFGNPPPPNHNLYQTGTPGGDLAEARIVDIPDEITEDGDYVFDGSVRG